MIVYVSTPIGAENGLFLDILGGDEFLLLQKLHQLRQLLEGSLVPLQAALSTHVATIFASLPPPTHTILAGEVRVHELAARQVLAVEGGHLHRQVLAAHLVQALPLTAPRRAYADAQVQELVVHLLLAHLRAVWLAFSMAAWDVVSVTAVSLAAGVISVAVAVSLTVDGSSETDSSHSTSTEGVSSG